MIDLVERVVVGIKSIQYGRGEGVLVRELWLVDMHHVVWGEDVLVEVCGFFGLFVSGVFHGAEVHPVRLVFHDVEVPQKDGGVGAGVLDVSPDVRV